MAALDPIRSGYILLSIGYSILYNEYTYKYIFMYSENIFY